ncbi:leucine-rich repeat-containing protein 4C [Lingula anatina]|uniref:Leucine-rich repeat-containing protein 4C n=1 Tax=Lingula anatina TaxID=7574 RepID=A0A1S3HH52_LINAN|nr:leucine-rich repeat-containing protein 4C [Lingula anatina]XP_013384811.1 leucine-rich repeat-containing protein 4C [Lingula anatina]|eukprot:XP_013384809.1 leucine-rich repeat-containing protein 4C [Lingula anatina]
MRLKMDRIRLCIRLLLLLLLFVACQTSTTTTVRTCPQQCSCHPMTRTVNCHRTNQTDMEAILNPMSHNTKELSIIGADFLSIPSTFSQFRQLQSAIVIECHIQTIHPEAFYRLSKLKTLLLRHNDLSVLSHHLFHELELLEELDLSYNNIEVIPTDLFQHLHRLSRLNLKFNHIRSLPPSTFEGLSRLTLLDLSHNRLQYVHPTLFQGLNSLNIIYLDHNMLETISEETFQNMTSLQKVFLHTNPYDCNCGLRWLQQSLTGDVPSYVTYPYRDSVNCSTPHHLHNRQLYSLRPMDLVCKEPYVFEATEEVVTFVRTNVVLNCRATGYPKPSVVWKTPHGELIVHHSYRNWLLPEQNTYHHSLNMRVPPYFMETSVHALSNGSLLIKSLRNYFVGKYQCIAVNPSGNSTHNMSVSLTSPLNSVIPMTLIIGGGVTGTFLLLSIIFGLFRMCIETLCCNDKMEKGGSIESLSGSPVRVSPLRRSPQRRSPPFKYWSPEGSPKKYFYSTPYESCEDDAASWDEEGDDDYDSDNENKSGSADIRSTLEEVRGRLAKGVGKRMGQMRDGINNIKASSRQSLTHFREASSQRMQHIRQSSNLYMQQIRASSSNAAYRVRQGVVLGVEQVKYHVKSMKELCGTGDLGQTISTVSIATDVDSQTTTEITTLHTFV